MLEYKQLEYPVAAGRFDGELNKMALLGWKAESIDRVDGRFLVTYSRLHEQELVMDRVNMREGFQDILGKRTGDGYKLISSNVFEVYHDSQKYGSGDFLHTLIWEKVRF